MARKSRIVSSTSSTKHPRRKRPPPAEAFQVVTAAAVTRGAGAKDIQVPMLVLYGEWLKALGFPIGSAVVLTTDKRGELALHRLGLRVPRRVYVRAMPR